jgi:hypothetical protein
MVEEHCNDPVGAASRRPPSKDTPYSRSPKGNATQARYRRSAKGKATVARYNQSDKRKTTAKRYENSARAKERRASHEARRKQNRPILLGSPTNEPAT